MSLSVSTMIFASALGTYMDIPSVQPWFPQHDPPSHSALDHWFGDQIFYRITNEKLGDANRQRFCWVPSGNLTYSYGKWTIYR